MPYCPNCKRDFEPGVKVCAFCEEPLVERLEEETPAQQESAQTEQAFFDAHPDARVIYTTFLPPQAAQIEAALGRARIPCFVRVVDQDEECGVELLGQPFDFLLDIYVPEEAAEPAQKVLEDVVGLVFADDAEIAAYAEYEDDEAEYEDEAEPTGEDGAPLPPEQEEEEEAELRRLDGDER